MVILMTDPRLERWIGILALLNLAMLAILAGRPHFSNASHPVRGISNPILAMELVRNVAEVDEILSDAPSPDRETMRIKQYADFGFIGGYAALFVLMSMLLMGQGRAIAISAALLGIIAAFCDVIENLGILRIVDVDLTHTTQAMIDAIRYPSLVKWTLASFALGMLGILAMRTRQTGLEVVGALDFLAALLGVCGAFYDNWFLQPMGLLMLGGFVGLAILFFRPHHWNRRRTAA